jgi:hypothetical protein
MSDPKSINVRVKGQADLGSVRRGIDDVNNSARRLDLSLGSIVKHIQNMTRDGGQGFALKGLGQLINLTAGGIAGGAMYSRISGGLGQYKQHLIMMDEEARTVKRLGEAYRDYQTNVVNAGRAYGYSNNEVIGLASTLARARGRAGADQLLPDMRTIQGFGRGYGMGATEAGGYFARSVEMGQIGRGGDIADMRQFAGLMADAIARGGMSGREGEVITSIQRLTGAIGSKMVTVGGSQIAASALATMNATGIRGLQGEAGASLLGQMNAAIMQPGGGEAGDLFMYRALSGGKPMALGDYRYLQEEGLAGVGPTGKSNFQVLMETGSQTGLGGRYQQMLMGQLTGISMHQVEALQNVFMKGGQFQTAKLGGLQAALGGDLQKVDPSVWGLLSELQAGTSPADIAKEFGQLSGRTPQATTKEGLFDEIKQYGMSNVAMSQGQLREKLDNDIAKASEDAGSKLYDLSTAADELTKRFIELGGSLPGPLGGIAPIALGSLGGSALSAGGQWGLKRLFGAGGRLLGGGAPAAAAEATAAGAPAVAGVGSAATPAAVAGGSSLLAGGLQFAGGIGLGAVAAYTGSEIGQRVYGTQALFSEGHRAAIGQGIANIAEGSTTGADLYNAAQGMQAAVPGVIGGTIYGAIRSLTGQEDFQSAYRSGFFNINTADSPGRRQWLEQQSQLAGGGGRGWGSSSGGSWGGGGEQLAAKVDQALKGTGMDGKGALLLELSRKYGVPIEVALAQARSAGASPETNNPFNVPGAQGGSARFPNIDVGIESYFQALGMGYQKELATGMQTGDWSSLVGSYPRPGQGDPQAAAAQMAALTQQYHQMLMPSSRGGWWNVGADDSPALLHKREMVLPANLADDLRQAISRPQITAEEARQGAGEIRVKIDPITIRLPNGQTTTVHAEGSYQPFQGVVDHPIRTVD